MTIFIRSDKELPFRNQIYIVKFSENQRFQNERISIVCEWLASFALFLLPVFFLLFCAVLLSVWYFGMIEWWLTTASTCLIVSMGLTASVFAVASASSPPAEESLRPSEPHPFRDLTAAPMNFVRMNAVPCRYLENEAEGFRVYCFNVDCAQGRADKARFGKKPSP
jgi:hypothetical protein